MNDPTFFTPKGAEKGINERLKRLGLSLSAVQIGRFARKGIGERHRKARIEPFPLPFHL